MSLYRNSVWGSNIFVDTDRNVVCFAAWICETKLAFVFLQLSLTDFYENFFYNKVCLSINHFVSNQMSSFYFHLVKDRLYCDAVTSLERRSAVTTLWNALKVFR